MSAMNPISNILEWVTSNIDHIVFSLIFVATGFLIYKIVVRQVSKLKEQKKLGEDLAWTLTRSVKWFTALLVGSVILSEFGVSIGVVSGLFAVVGGTIIGFASINTLGNALAGFIVMTNKPFSVSDRIRLNGQIADVEGVELIYTKLRTLDNVVISIPNQELLKTEIHNFGKKRMIRRQITVTPGYQYEHQQVETALLEAAEQVEEIRREPKPYVWITQFHDYAVEYTLYVFINTVQHIPQIEAELRKQILTTVRKYKIDIRTPLLLQHERLESERRDQVQKASNIVAFSPKEWIEGKQVTNP